MQLRRILPALTAAVLPLAVVTVGTAAPANAASVGIADYSASAGSSVVSTDVAIGSLLTTMVGPGLPGTVSANVGTTSAAADTTMQAKTSADGSNVDIGAVGLSLTRVSGHAEQPAGPDTMDWTSADADLSPVADLGVISGTAAANWNGANACVPDGTPLSQSSTTVASADLLPLPNLIGVGQLTGASLSAATTTSRTELQANGGTDDSRAVVSTASTTPVDLQLLSGAAAVSLTSAATLTSSATGSAPTTTTTYAPPSATVTVGNNTQTLTVGTPVTKTVALLNGLLSATVTLTLNQPDITDNGLTAAGSVASVLHVHLDVSMGTQSVLTGSLDLFPLATSATAPAGGIQCVASQIAPPTVVTPANGAWTTPTPTITGTGIPGATVHVLVAGTGIGDVTADQGGSWTLSWPSSPLAPGTYEASARQTVQGDTSGLSNVNTFHVAIPPVITSPADGSTTTDTTPKITGTGQPGATVEVFVDGQDLGPADIDDNGDWSLPVTTPLAPGPHTVDATQTDQGGNALDAPHVEFTVVAEQSGGGQPDNGPTGNGSTGGDQPNSGNQPGPHQAADELPNTGAPAGALWAGLVGLLLLGAGGYALRRGVA